MWYLVFNKKKVPLLKNLLLSLKKTVPILIFATDATSAFVSRFIWHGNTTGLHHFLRETTYFLPCVILTLVSSFSLHLFLFLSLSSPQHFPVSLSLSLSLYIYIYMEVNYKNKSDSIKKIEKQCILNVIILFIMVKSTLIRFGFIKTSSGLYDREKLLLE